jgi:RNA ligase (TIGR02306 family)
MSKLIVEVCEILSREKHPEADKLDLFQVKGWQIIANRKEDGEGNLVPRYNVGDHIIYIPPDAILPLSLADKYGFTNYLSPVKDEFGTQIGGRVRAIRLRGQPSYGCMFEAESDLPVGTDVAEKLGITKWEPPPESRDGDAEKSNSSFHAYTSIENIGNFPNILEDGEEVVFTEKLHGTNFRVGKIAEQNETGEKTYVYAAGSHGVRRKEFGVDENRSKYWEPMTENMKKLLDHLCGDQSDVIVYGEIYGAGVQDMAYGLVGARSFRVFDIAINGRYMNYDDKKNLFDQFGIEMVPILYRGPFSKEILKEHTSGSTTMCPVDKAGKFKGREGVVITPTIERHNMKIGRVILKSISADYLGRKGGTDSH